jgi:outer membrane protein OmpA-like peptidoglycan-associated protein
MGDNRSFNDAFAPRKAQGKDGFVRPGATSAVAKTPARGPGVDAFKPAPKPAKVAKPLKASPATDAFAPKAKVETPKPPKSPPATPSEKRTTARLQRPPARPKAASAKHEVALKPVQRPDAKLPPLVRAPEQPAARIPPLVGQAVAAKQPAMVRGEPVPKPGNQFGRSRAEPKVKQRALTPAGAPKVSALTPPPKQAGGKGPAMAFAAAGGSLPKPRGGAIYNPFDRKRFVQSTPSHAEDVATPGPSPDPFFDLQPKTAEAPPAGEPRRALHVVPRVAMSDPTPAPKSAKSGTAARSSSLVLVSGGGAVAAAEAAEASDAPPAEKPPEPAPVAAEPAPAVAAAEPAKGGGGGGRDGGGGGGPPRRLQAMSNRGFMQDDIFGVVFGIAVIAFLLLWFMRGKGEETAESGALFAAQSAPVQRLAVSPTPLVPAPLPPADPFGQGPVDLTPQGPIPEALPPPPEVADAEPTPVAPTPASPAPAAAAPAPATVESTLPLAERKMHAWFCTASSRLTKASRTELNGELDKFANLFAGKELVVRGYADTRGSTEYNSALSGTRASVVADFLRTKGLTVVDAEGVGELDGLDDNQNCANQRRVDVWVKGGPAEAPSRACAPEPDVESLVCG